MYTDLNIDLDTCVWVYVDIGENWYIPLEF